MSDDSSTRGDSLTRGSSRPSTLQTSSGEESDGDSSSDASSEELMSDSDDDMDADGVIRADLTRAQAKYEAHLVCAAVVNDDAVIVKTVMVGWIERSQT